MRRVTNPPAPRQTQQTQQTLDQFEREVFASRSEVWSMEFLGMGKYDRVVYALDKVALEQAYAEVAAKPRAVLYCANAKGRSVVLDRLKKEYWLALA